MSRKKKQKKQYTFANRKKAVSTQPSQMSVERHGSTVKVEPLYPDTLARRPHLEYAILQRRQQSLVYTPDGEFYVLPFQLVGQAV